MHPTKRFLLRLLMVAVVLTPALPAFAVAAQDESDTVVVVEDTFDDPTTGVLQEGSDDPDLRFDYDDDGYEIDAFADDFSGDLTVPVPGDFANGTIAIDATLSGKNDSNGHYIFAACRVRDDTGYKFEVRPLAGVAAIWKLSSDGNERIANVGLEGDPGSGPYRIEFSCNGNELTGRIDGEEIVSVTDDTYDTGSFAFGAGVYRLSAGPVSADFDNLTVSVPADEVPATPEATPEPVIEETETAAPEATVEPTEVPTEEATAVATEGPTEEATTAPTEEPTVAATETSSEASTAQPGEFDRSGMAAAVDQLRSQAGASAPVFGPSPGETDLSTGVDLKDFVVSTSFTVPDSDGWSAGYGFRQNDASSATVLVSANGTWSLAAGTEQVRAAGLIESLNITPGESNIVELVASGETGYLTVNGEFVGQLDISSWADAGDITLVGATAGAESTVSFFDATVWSLEVAPEEIATQEPTEVQESTPTALPPVEASPSPEATEVASPQASPVSDEDAEAEFDAIVASTDDLDPVAGPVAGSVNQAVGSLDIASAGVVAENFYTTVRFSNPASPSDPDHAWDIVLGFWHTGGDDQVRLVIASDGTWSVAVGTARPIVTGEVGNLNLGASRGNDIALAVQDGTGYLEVNGEFVSSFEVPSEPQAGDIWLASGTFPENAQEGVETLYSDWTVWSLERG